MGGQGIMASRVSTRNQNGIRVGDGIARANQADGEGHAFFKFDMRFEKSGNTLERAGKLLTRGGRIVFEKFLCLEGLRELMVCPHGGDELAHRRQIIDDGDVHRFNHRPERKAAVGNDERVSVAHPGQEREEMRIENAMIYHDAKLVVPDTHAKW